MIIENKSNILNDTWKICHEKAYNSPILTSFLLSFIFFIGYFSFFTSTFETNDDAYMLFFSSGFYLGKPVEYILPSGVFLGIILKNFYSVFPTGNWYVWYLIFVHFISVWIILFLGIKSSKNISLLLFLLLSIVYFESYFLVYLQFTTTAFLVSMAGTLYFLQTILKEKKSIFPFLVAIPLLLIASQIREKVPLLVLAIFSPAFLYFSLFHGIFKNALIFGTLFIGLFVISQWLENNYKGTIEDWGEHRELFDEGFYPVYNKSGIDYIEDPTFFKKLGWSENDFLLFKQGFFEQMPKYSMQNLRLIAEHFESKKMSVASVLNTLIYILIKYKYLTVLTFLSLICVFFHTNWKYNFSALAMLFFAFGISIVLGQNLILKSRVIVPQLLIIQLFCVYGCFLSPLKFDFEKLKFKNIFINMTLLIFITLGVARIYLNNKKNIKPMVQQFTLLYNELEKSYPNQVFATWGLSFSIDHIDILSNFYKDKQKSKLYIMLANLGYWHNPTLLEKYGEKNIYEALLKNDKFLLVLSSDKIQYLNNLYQYYWENYSIKVEGEFLQFIPDPLVKNAGISIYKIKNVNP